MEIMDELDAIDAAWGQQQQSEYQQMLTDDPGYLEFLDGLEEY